MRTISFVFFTFLFTKICAQTLSTSLTACYDLNGTASEPVSNLTGTISAATPTVDRFNVPSSALHFNGNTNCFVRLPDNPLLKPTNALSFALWVRPELVSGGKHIVYTRNNQSSNFEAYQLCIFSGAPVFRLNKADASHNDLALSTTTVSIGTWYHVVCTIDNSNLRLYVNGVLEGSTAVTFNGYDYMFGREVFVGASNEFFNLPFTGSVDNLKFWNRVITQTEVTQLYNNDPTCSLMGAPISSFVPASYTACAGSAISFTDLSINNPTSWKWQVTGGTTYTTSTQSPTINFPTPGVYTVGLTTANSWGTSTAVKTITVFTSPSVNLVAGSNSVCAGSSVGLVASGATTYSWSTSQNGFSIQATPQTTTIYTVTGMSSGCVGQATLEIIVNTGPVLAAVSSTNEICQGSSVGLAAAGAVTYSWSTGHTSSSFQFTPVLSSTYTVIGTGATGCTSQATLSVKVNASPVVTASTKKLNVCAGEKVSMTASGAQSYLWNTSQTSSVITATVLNNTSYFVTGTNSLGCTATATLSILTEICAGIFDLENDNETRVTCFPNPVTDFITIRSNKELQLNIFDVTGRVLKNVSVKDDAQINIDMSGFSRGIYFLTDSKNAIRPIRIVKE